MWLGLGIVLILAILIMLISSDSYRFPDFDSNVLKKLDI